MKPSKFNYYINSGNSTYILNTLSESITCIPVSTFRGNFQTGEVNSNLELQLQELGMMHEDDIDEDCVYHFWTKKRNYDESCFKINIFLGSNDYSPENPSDNMQTEDSAIMRPQSSFVDSLISLSSMLFSYNVEVNFLNCETVNCELLKEMYFSLMSYQQQFPKMRVNFAYNAFAITDSTIDFLQENGICDSSFRVLCGMNIRQNAGFSVIFSKSIFSSDSASSEVHIVIHPACLEAHSELTRIPTELRGKVSVHFHLSPRICLRNEVSFSTPSKDMESLFSVMFAVSKLGYKINPLEIIQHQCCQVTDHTITVLPNGEICKCAMNPKWKLKIDGQGQIIPQLYQYMLASDRQVNKFDGCSDCTFLPWCTQRCLIECVHSPVTERACPKMLYEQLSQQIVSIWRRIKNETT